MLLFIGDLSSLWMLTPRQKGFSSLRKRKFPSNRCFLSASTMGVRSPDTEFCSCQHEKTIKTTWPFQGRIQDHLFKKLAVVLPRKWRSLKIKKKRTTNLELLYQALLNLPPTSVSSERAFSVSGHLVSRRRSSLKDSSIDSLCFLHGWFVGPTERFTQ